MKIEISDTKNGPAYVTVREPGEKGVARTVEIVPSELMVDLDIKGDVLGVEILTPALLSKVPAVLKRYGVAVPTLMRPLFAATLRKTGSGAKATVGVAKENSGPNSAAEVRYKGYGHGPKITGHGAKGCAKGNVAKDFAKGWQIKGGKKVPKKQAAK